MITTTKPKASRPQFLVYDTLDDRREIHTLLSKLHPRVAVCWLDKLCKRATIHGARPGPSRAMWARVEVAERKGGDAAARLANEIYGDVWMLCSQHGLNIDDAIRQLEELVRRRKDKD
jgi:hypothetical protein